MTEFRVARSARKHRIGNTHILTAIANAGEPIIEGDTLTYIGKDDRGVELTIIVIPDDRKGWVDSWTIIHAMPTHY